MSPNILSPNIPRIFEYFAWADDPGASGSPTGKSNYASVDWGTRAISLGSDETFRSPDIDFNTDNGLDIVRINTDKFVICYADSSDSEDGKCIVGDKSGGGGGNNAPSAPTSLETEGQTNPTDITDPTPEFSAIYNDPDGSDVATDYQLQVSTTSSFSSTHWNTGKTSLASSTPQGTRIADISYSGSALASSTTYYWRIKFWDTADAEGAWSTATSTFSLAAGGGGGGTSTPSTVLQNIFYTYDNVGNITNITDYSDTGAGKIVNYDYDDLYRLISAATSAASSTAFSETYAYDALGNITSKSDQGTYTYTGSGYLNPHAVSQIANGVSTTTYAYDESGNVTGAGSWTYSWDYRNRLATSTNGAAATTYGYDHENQRVKKAANGVTTVYPNKYFNTTGSTSTIHLFLPDGSLVGTVEQSEAAGQGGGATSTGFKSPSATGTTWNEWSDPSNAYASDDTRADAFGLGASDEQDYSSFSFNIASGATITGIEVQVEAQRLQIDQELGINLSWNGGSSWTATSTKLINTSSDALYTYGSSTETWGRTWSDTDFSNANFRLYARDTTATNRTISVDHIQVKVYYTTSGGEGGGPTATTTSYIHTDHLGSTNVVTDRNGTVVQVLDYYPYGDERISTGEETTDRHFIGERFDESTSLSYLNSRYYSGDRGQFISQDPTHLAVGNVGEIRAITGLSQQEYLRDPQLLNSYSYGRNNPLRFKDPQGKYIEVSGSATVPGRTFSAGLRFDGSGVDFFMGGGFGMGLQGGFGLAWVPGKELSHQREASFVANGSAAYFGGVRVSQDLSTYYPDTGMTQYGGDTDVALTLGLRGGLSGSVEEELSKPLYVWGNKSGPTQSRAPVVQTSSSMSRPMSNAPQSSYSQSSGSGGASLNSLLSRLSGVLSQLKAALSSSPSNGSQKKP